ncbi:MAG: hypothetical protein Q7J22_01545 [Candidatus Wolfebacteria bacterium]|nr:hypothetical protein [Candidatus Wolfebacteria bacterium]
MWIALLSFLLTLSLPLSFSSRGAEPPLSPPPVVFLPLPPHIEEMPPPEVIFMKVTAYCSCALCSRGSGVTALGDKARTLDGVAADFTLLPPRTVLFIPGIGEREVDDTGRDMREAARAGQYHIDVRFSSHSKALAFGSRVLPVTILTP